MSIKQEDIRTELSDTREKISLLQDREEALLTLLNVSKKRKNGTRRSSPWYGKSRTKEGKEEMENAVFNVLPTERPIPTRVVVERVGNMSSGTVTNILKRLREQGRAKEMSGNVTTDWTWTRGTVSIVPGEEVTL